MEDSNVTFLLEIHAKGAPIEDLTVDLLLPSEKPISFRETEVEMGSWIKWETSWQPSGGVQIDVILHPKSPVNF